jgi:hypothetical protein
MRCDLSSQGSSLCCIEGADVQSQCRPLLMQNALPFSDAQTH